MAKKVSPGRAQGAERIKYNKNKILGMKRYADRRDLLEALLRDDETYLLEAVDAAMGEFMKGRVK